MIITVAVPGPFATGLDYIYPFEDPPKLYSRILVPLGKRQIIGMVIKLNSSTDLDHKKLKKVIKVIDQNAVVSANSMKVINWLAKYYHAPIYQVFKIALPKLLLQKEYPAETRQVSYTLTGNQVYISRNAHKQQKVINILQTSTSIRKSDLKDNQISLSTIQALIKKEIIQEHHSEQNHNLHSKPLKQHKQLNEQQQNAVSIITSNTTEYSTTLLYGITGSGKTEVYLQSIDKLINDKKQVLVLVPEINLTPQTLQRFKNRFGVAVVALNSKVTDQKRLEYWFGIKQNNIKIVISTRAGLLYDFADLGMIIVDEEHDSSFKQQSGIHYNARDTAIVTAKQHNIPIILGSATPSIESYMNAKNGKYKLVALHKRALNTLHNNINIINMQKQPSSSIVSSSLKNEILKAINNQSQVLVFVNRRGFAHRLICHDCGWCAQCNKCDKAYTLHLHPQHLSCHFCNSGRVIYTKCPSCKSDQLADYGAGTEKVEQNLSELFPQARITRLDRSISSKKDALEKQLNQIKERKTDIIIGTQMVAKGHDFQHVSLVGILYADNGFYSQDFHAMEKTAQLITQVSGRTGRGSKKGSVFIQTLQPDNQLLHLILHKPYGDFLDKLLITRQSLNYPPFSQQAYIYVQSPQVKTCIDSLNTLKSEILSLNNKNKFDIIGPIPAISVKHAGRYKFCLMLTAKYKSILQSIISSISYNLHKPSKARLSIDIDPIDIK